MKKTKEIDRKGFPFISASELLEIGKVPAWDLHIHTCYTDGKATVDEVFKRAIEVGLEVIAFTEHTEVWRTDRKNWFADYSAEIEELRAKYSDQIQALIGVEANAISCEGGVEMTGLMKQQCELVLGAAHRYPGLGTRRVQDLSGEEGIEMEYRTLMGLASSKEIDVIAHVGATCSKYCAPFPKNLTREIVAKATKNNIAIEINPVYHKPLIGFLELCAEENASISLGSNAHGYGDIGLIVRDLEAVLGRK